MKFDIRHFRLYIPIGTWTTTLEIAPIIVVTLLISAVAIFMPYLR
jgi:hypothetical protein